MLANENGTVDWETKLKAIRRDPVEFFKIVRTLDQVDRVKPIKNFPTNLDYLKLYAAVWKQKRLLLVPKSRRMKLSWTTICLYLWDTMFNIGTHNAFVSKKEDDSDELVKRAHFVLENLDHSQLPKDFIPRYEYTFNKLRFPELESQIQGFPSGADQLRQFTFSGLLFDELAFWDNAEKAYSGSYPTIEGGGRMTGISSASPGFFERMVFDKIDGEASDLSSVKRFFPMQGVEIWENPRNKFTVFQIHYTADPVKRSDEFKRQARQSMPIRQYNMEYEIAWESWEGLPVYPDFDEKIHAVDGDIAPYIGLPLFRGWDFGLTPACVIGQIQEDQLCIMYEFVAKNMGAERFSQNVLKKCQQLWPNWADKQKDWIDIIDPSGTARKDTDENSCAKILSSKEPKGRGLAIHPGLITWEDRRTAVEHFLTRRTRQGPCFKISRSHCPVLVKGFKGGYQYPEKNLEKEPSKIRPIKNEFSHPHDGLQYIAGKIVGHKPRSRSRVPPPHYSWSNPEGAIINHG